MKEKLKKANRNMLAWVLAVPRPGRQKASVANPHHKARYKEKNANPPVKGLYVSRIGSTILQAFSLISLSINHKEVPA